METNRVYVAAKALRGKIHYFDRAEYRGDRVYPASWCDAWGYYRNSLTLVEAEATCKGCLAEFVRRSAPLARENS